MIYFKCNQKSLYNANVGSFSMLSCRPAECLNCGLVLDLVMRKILCSKPYSCQGVCFIDFLLSLLQSELIDICFRKYE